MTTALTRPSAWRLIATAALIPTFVAVPVLSAWVASTSGSPVHVDWFLGDAMSVSVLFGAPLLGAWGTGRTPGSTLFHLQHVLTALTLFSAYTSALFFMSARPIYSLPIHLWIAIVLALCTSELYRIALQLVSLSPRLASRARRIVWCAALAGWLLPCSRFALGDGAEGPFIFFRPVANVLLGSGAPTVVCIALPLVLVALALARRALSVRLPSPLVQS